VAELEEDITAWVRGHRDTSGEVELSIAGELDLASVETVRRGIDEVIGTAPRRIVFDLGDLTFMDSSGIAMMLQLANRVDDIEIRNATPIVRRVIEATGLTTALGLQP
jgi:anti-sigma B factor antagonist